MASAWIQKLLFNLYMTCRFLLLGSIADIDRVSACILVFIKPFLIAGEAFLFRARSEKSAVSNHFIQDHDLICFKSETILIRFQTFKEPDAHSLFR